MTNATLLLERFEREPITPLFCAAAEPGEVTGWAAYADYLRESDDPDRVARGEVIASWLGKKAVPNRNGLLQTARGLTMPPANGNVLRDIVN